MSMLFLIGMPASGKSYMAAKLSASYNIPYLDTDVLVEQEANTTIATLFAQKGENVFRELERQILKKVIEAHTSNIIIACGGGTPVYADNMQLMKTAGCVVYLDTSIDVLVSRINHDFVERPLLKGGGIREKLEAILKRRKNIYELAHYIVPADNISVANFDEIVNTCIKGR